MSRKLLLPESGNLYKANLHCHSTISDGAYSPEELKKMYMEKGYHAIAYTDHKVCVPHTELTDENFVALTGFEIAFGIRKATSVHMNGIARNPMTEFFVDNEDMDDVEKMNAGIKLLNDNDFISTLNHPRWSGILMKNIEKLGDVANIEVVNGFELIRDGYGDSSTVFEMELRRGRKVRPFATDDSHKADKLEYFQGFTVIKAAELSYDALVEGLDAGNFFASTGPMFQNLWLDGNILHVECSPVCGVYVHGQYYSHRAAEIAGEDTIQVVDIDLGDTFANSDYLFVQIVDKQGKRAWSCPLWL